MAAKLVSMKIDPATRMEQNKPSSVATESVYPYGLELRLDDEALDKLKLETLPEVGETLVVLAKASVTNVSSTQTSDGKRQSLSLQITHLCLEDGGEKVSAEDALYTS